MFIDLYCGRQRIRPSEAEAEQRICSNIWWNCFHGSLYGLAIKYGHSSWDDHYIFESIQKNSFSTVERKISNTLKKTAITQKQPRQIMFSTVRNFLEATRHKEAETCRRFLCYFYQPSAKHQPLLCLKSSSVCAKHSLKQPYGTEESCSNKITRLDAVVAIGKPS